MTSVLFLGDTHGDRGFTRHAIDFAADNGIDQIVQVGDFGYWPRINSGRDYIHEVGKHANKREVQFNWIAGNHEDHDALDEMVARSDAQFVAHGKYPIFHIRSGSSWTWGNTRFGALGGAFSIDRANRGERSPRFGWFPQEVPDESLIPGLGKVDILITHDSPIIPPGGHNFLSIPESALCQDTVRKAQIATEASLVIHGHWHLNLRYGVHSATVQGLDCNGSPIQYASVVVDTETTTLYTVNEWLYRGQAEEEAAQYN